MPEENIQEVYATDENTSTENPCDVNTGNTLQKNHEFN